MKYLLGALLILTAAGCVTNHQEVLKPPPAQPAPPPPPVTANQVNNQNAHAISQALWDEMDRDSQGPPVSEASPATSPMKK